MLLGAAPVIGCDVRPGDESARPVSVREVLDGPRHGIDITGLDTKAVRRLAVLEPNDSQWRRVVAVYVEPTPIDSSESPTATVPPAIIGRVIASNDRIRFEPRFPFAEGVAYRVEVDTAALARPERRSAPLTHRFAIPAVARARTTRILGVYPASHRLPANLLRWYVETSAPMEPGNALAHVHLLDESGREVSGAFLALEQELWDPERRRLTLLFDPGRVKRGVRTNVESGAPLVAGRRYRLVIDDEWKDGTGAALASGFELAFEVTEPDRRSPDPARWRLTPPRAGTRSGLHVAFGESLDHALASRLLEVLDDRGAAVPGSVALAANDSLWVFSPHRDWKAGEYTLRVGGALEDLAGNNVVRVFDVDRDADSAGVDRDVSGSTRTVRFRIL